MAKDTDGLFLTASLDIDGTYKKIKEEDITKLNAKLANDNSARVKIVGGLDLNKTQSLIQSQIATISKNLKLDISSIDTSSLNTTLSNVQNKIIGTNNGLTIKPTVDGKIIEDTDTLIKAVVGKLQQLNNIDLKTFKDNLKNIFGVSSKEISDDATSLINNLRLKPEDTAAIIQDYNNLIESIRNTFISKGMGNITDGMNFENNVVTSIYKAATNIKAANEQVEQSNQSIINSEQRVAEILTSTNSAFNSSNNDIKKYTNLIDKATTKLNNLQNDSTFLKNSSNPQVAKIKQQIVELITNYQTLRDTLQGDLTPEGITTTIAEFNKLDTKYKEITNDANALKTSISANDTMSKQAQQAELLSSRIKKLVAEINTYKNANSRMMSSNKLTSNGNTFAQELENMLLQLSHCASTEDFQKIAANFRGIKAEAKQLGIEGGTVFTTLWEKLKKFSSWMSMTSVVSTFVMDIRNAIVELKEVNTLLTEISKANDKLTSSQLAQIGNNSFGVASKYGKTATDYLAGVQEMSRAGYANAEAMGELSTAAQGAGDMTSDTANQFIIAADKAYKMNGSVEELTKTLDGINYITNNNAVNMSELSEGFSIVASTAASFDVTAQELAAALSTMSATTQQSGSEVARAFRAILLNIRQVSDEEENIDAEGLTKYEKACNDLGVSLKEVKDGVLQLRDPMEVLKELSVEYNKLDEADLKRTNLLNSIGGKLRATQLDAILRQWDMYEEMLQQYTDGSGSMANEANKTANSIEGLWNSLKNDWTSFVNEFANSDLFKSLIESARRLIDVLSDASSPLNSILTQFANLLELATKFTDKIGLIPTIFAGLSLKNVGELILKYARFRITTDIKCGECNTF